MKNTKELTDVEWTTCWMAVRYAMRRSSIAAATLPAILISAYWHRWTDVQKKMLAKDIGQAIAEQEEYFPELPIDKPWYKLQKLCDIENYKIITTKDGTKHVVFEINNAYYPVNEYVNNSWHNVQIVSEYIAEIGDFENEQQ
ncbi:MAG: hypothetical protein GX660_19120 [Clostridiaceae bacterium]|nr:hypothetical protein [Clostridiaceae bacterium]